MFEMNDTLISIVESHLSTGHVLLDVSEDKRGNYIRVVIDSECSVTLDDTTQLSQSLRDSNEIDARFPGGFRLEVTTPGLDQPLQYPFQYRKNIARQLKVIFMDGEIVRSLTGTVVDADDASVTLKDGIHDVSLSYDKIKSAKVKISFK